MFIPKLYNGRNKTFFLADYEGERQTQATTALAAVFPNAYRSGDLSAIKTPIKDAFGSGNPFPNNVIPASLLAPQALKTLAYMPTANLAGAAANNYVAQIGGGNNTDQTLDKVDENLGDKAHLFFRYAYQNASLIQGSSNPINGFNVPLTDRNYAVGYTQTLSPRMVNDFHFGYHKSLYSSVNFFTSDSLAGSGTALGIPGFSSSPANPGIPDFEITGFVAIGGQNMTSSNWTRPDSTYRHRRGFLALDHGKPGAERLARPVQFHGWDFRECGGRFSAGAASERDLGGHRRAGAGAAVARRFLCFRQMERLEKSDSDAGAAV